MTGSPRDPSALRAAAKVLLAEAAELERRQNIWFEPCPQCGTEDIMRYGGKDHPFLCGDCVRLLIMAPGPIVSYGSVRTPTIPADVAAERDRKRFAGGGNEITDELDAQIQEERVHHPIFEWELNPFGVGGDLANHVISRTRLRRHEKASV